MNAIERDELLRYVRHVAGDMLAGRPPCPPPTCAAGIPCGGAFVTLRNHGDLRGCMGRFVEGRPLADVLPDIVASALADPRFVDRPITATELPAIHFEISILGPLEPVTRPETLIAGRHGVVIARGDRRGCFLPQVASERNWSIETFLSECCRQKAGLASDAWRDPETRISAFETTILSDEERPTAGDRPG